jgi:hypothetical protein
VHLRDAVILTGWLMGLVGALLALGVGFGLLAVGVGTVMLGLFALEGR